MPVDVRKTLRQALSKLNDDKQKLDRQIEAIQGALQALDGRVSVSEVGAARAERDASMRRRKRRTMSRAARKAVSARMKAYWAKRRSGKKVTSGKKKSTTAANERP